MQKPQNLKGFRDFLPAEKRVRAAAQRTMQEVFERFGFEPLETPTLEYASLLLGKYGDEADKLVYNFTDRGDRNIALRYDQTVPTARVLAQYQNELPKYFRRYQIQNVFRADKPQKGRYREFTQSDCDIFGSTSPVADAEILAVFYAVFKALGIATIQIQINDRKTLFSVLEPFSSTKIPVLSLTQTVDKLDKQTPKEVTQELVAKGLSQTQAETLLGNLKNAEMSAELTEIVAQAVALGVPRESLVPNPNLARGLDYYTGMIFEAIVPESNSGSLGGGGRYDNLINELAGVSIPAVGFGIGFDRTVEVAAELGTLTTAPSAQILITLFDQAQVMQSLEAATKLRDVNIPCEVVPAVEKLAKQFKLANQKKIPYVLVIGEQEAASGLVTLKNMKTGTQETLSLEAVVTKLQTEQPE